ncbi:MAG TPA: hypoxanthine phosphoribosyltransferase, partial [Amycolatopsis sp.]|nr:hypoxanthine phosphoribosyltransferase [Amycolatopsis sp.]
MYEGEIASVLVTEQQIQDKITELAKQIAADYAKDGVTG